MMRKPIFTGIATILALALTAGLAFGAGRLVSTRNDANQVAQRGARVEAVQPGFQGFNGTTFRHQMRQWTRDRFASFRGRMNFAANRRISWGRCDRSGCMNRGTSYRGNGYHHHSVYHVGSPSYSGGGYLQHSGYHDGDHRGSGSWGGGNHGGWGGGNRGGCCGW
jgi:hypothetical protein